MSAHSTADHRTQHQVKAKISGSTVATISMPRDAFASGQMGSKIWLCDQLGPILRTHQCHEGLGYIIWVYGGWVGTLPLLLFAHPEIPVKRIVLFDLDRDAVEASIQINDYWHWKGIYRAIAQDVCEKSFLALQDQYHEAEPHFVINTSVEHMPNKIWYDSLRPKKLVVLQSTNQKHDEPTIIHDSVDRLHYDYPLTDLVFKDQLDFEYGNATSFQRFMMMGFK